MSLDFLTLDNRTVWSSLVERLPESQRDIHFLPEYGEIYQKVYGHEPLLAYFDAGSQGFALQPFVKRSVSDLPFLKNTRMDGDCEYFDVSHPYGYGGPVFSCSSGSPEQLLTEFSNLVAIETSKRGWASEFTSVHPLLGNHAHLLRAGLLNLQARKSVVFVDLTKPLEEIWKGFDKGHKSSIKKAQRSDILVERVPPTPENLSIFNELYYHTMKRRGAAERWLFPEPFFAQTVKSLGDNRASLFFAILDRKAIAAYFLIHDFSLSYLHFTGAREEFLKLSPNNLLMFECIKWSKDKGYRFFHLGGGVTDSEADPLFSFKAGFSSDKATLYTYGRVLNESNYERLSHLKSEFEITNFGKESKIDFFPSYRR